MSFVSRFLRGEMALWKSFWLASAQPFTLILIEFVYQFLFPRPFYPHQYSLYSIAIRLSVYLFFLLTVLVLAYGTWKSASKYEGKSFLKWLAKLVLIFNALCICLSLLMHAVEFVQLDPIYYPYELKNTH